MCAFLARIIALCIFFPVSALSSFTRYSPNPNPNPSFTRCSHMALI